MESKFEKRWSVERIAHGDFGLFDRRASLRQPYAVFPSDGGEIAEEAARALNAHPVHGKMR